MTTTGKHARENGSKMKKRILAIAAAAMCCAFMAGGTLAYFTASETAHNVITSGGVEIKLNEWGDKVDDDGSRLPFESGQTIMPGKSVTKVVEVENTGANAAWVRVKVEKGFVTDEGPVVGSDSGLILITCDEDNWTEGDDGYWYYNKPLPAKSADNPGVHVTEPLFKAVGLATSTDNPYQGLDVVVNVTAYAVQVANNGDEPGDDVFDAIGWPEN